VMGEFPARTFDELYDGTTALPWGEWLPEDAEFPVTGKSVKSQLSSVPACQGIAKKAVVDALTREYGATHFDETGPRYRVQVALLKDTAMLTLDTSGEGLHKRGYRDVSAPAPLRETLAAAMVYLSHWRPGSPLADPCCGSGTIPIEAAMIGRNIAPGTLRSFDAFRWDLVPRELWSEALEEADDLARPDQGLRIAGSDISPEAIELARHHAARAGLEDGLEFRVRPLADFRPQDKYGYVICNPPYGERLGDLRAAEALYRDMGTVFRSVRDWSWFALTPHEEFERLFGAAATHRRKLYNGGILCWLYQYFGPRPPQGDG
jgi:putative N6-adenine-specific DNA methylase